MHHDCRRRVRGQPLAGELVAGLVFVQIELQPGQPLSLNAQHHHRLRLAHRRLEVALDLDSRTGLGRYFRQQFFGTAEQYTRAQPRQQQHVRASHAAVQNVAHNRHRHAVESVRANLANSRPQMRQDRAQVKQRLRGVLVHAVACVHHRQARRFFQQPRRS